MKLSCEFFFVRLFLRAISVPCGVVLERVLAFLEQASEHDYSEGSQAGRRAR